MFVYLLNNYLLSTNYESAGILLGLGCSLKETDKFPDTLEFTFQ